MIEHIQNPSLLQGFSDKKSERIDWQHVFRYLTEGSLQQRTENYRHRPDAAVKSRMPCITPAVWLNGCGKQENDIEGYTGVALADFDKLPPEAIAACVERIQGDPHTFLLHTTLSGRGLRVLFRYDAKRLSYASAFLIGNCHYADLIGHAFDEKCSNPNRLSVLCHDPQTYWQPDSVPFGADDEALPDAAPTDDRPPRRPDGTTRRTPMRDEGRQPLLPLDPIGRAVQIVEQQGHCYAKGSRNNYLMHCLMLMNKLGVPRAEASQWASTFSLPDGEAQAIVRSCYSHTSEHATYEAGRWASEPVASRPQRAADDGPKNPSAGKRKRVSPQEIADFLTLQADFRFNVISDQTEIRWKQPTGAWTPVTDRDIASLWMRMAQADITGNELQINSVLQSDFTPVFDPFLQYFNQLPPWQGDDDAIAALASRVHLVGETDELRQRFTHCLRKWLVAMVAGLVRPEVVNHEILVFIGRQGNYKSTFFARLLPPELRKYFYAKLHSEQISKDDLFTLTQYALISFEEIDCLKPAELNRMKALTTMQTVNERRAYGRHKEHRRHIASFCATGNNVQFLNDRTGNRRWLPFEVDSIDSPVEHPFDYEGIYAQAWHLLNEGFTYWFSTDEISELNGHTAHFEAPCLEAEQISTYYQKPEAGLTTCLVTTAQILERINAQLKQPLTAQKVGVTMRNLGFMPVRTRLGVKYAVHERTYEEIAESKRAETSGYDWNGEKLPPAAPSLPPAQQQSVLPF